MPPCRPHVASDSNCSRAEVVPRHGSSSTAAAGLLPCRRRAPSLPPEEESTTTAAMAHAAALLCSGLRRCPLQTSAAADAVASSCPDAAAPTPPAPALPTAASPPRAAARLGTGGGPLLRRPPRGSAPGTGPCSAGHREASVAPHGCRPCAAGADLQTRPVEVAAATAPAPRAGSMGPGLAAPEATASSALGEHGGRRRPPSSRASDAARRSGRHGHGHRASLRCGAQIGPPPPLQGREGAALGGSRGRGGVGPRLAGQGRGSGGEREGRRSSRERRGREGERGRGVGKDKKKT
ncbi:hypothetical protein C2845_PM13G12230 [Panicum miliaceum]|uniref:Uncharacterized protein n=1 Tax=Panicum miliaceum TaxID=4540 RepID=A0A3L6RJ60_PANMI|nr:hypothetical protein C2845_PM13G12230 [Panicum miliaceum]